MQAAFSNQIRPNNKSIMSKKEENVPQGKKWEKMVLTAAGWIMAVSGPPVFRDFSDIALKKERNMQNNDNGPAISTPESAPPNHLNRDIWEAQKQDQSSAAPTAVLYVL